MRADVFIARLTTQGKIDFARAKEQNRSHFFFADTFSAVVLQTRRICFLHSVTNRRTTVHLPHTSMGLKRAGLNAPLRNNRKDALTRYRRAPLLSPPPCMLPKHLFSLLLPFSLGSICLISFGVGLG